MSTHERIPERSDKWGGRRHILPLSMLLLLLAGLFSASGAFAQAVMGAREVGMGQTVTAVQGSPWALFGNPALMDRSRSSVSFFGIRYYGFANLTDVAAAATVPTGLGVVGAGAYRYGDDLFSESRIRLGYKNAYKGFHFGAVINYNHVAIGGGYGSAGALGVDVGLAALVVPGLWMGARATNINQPAYDGSDEKLPRDLSVGLSYALSDKALFAVDLVKDVRFPLSWRGGVEVAIFNHVFGRAGVTTNPRTFALGFGYDSKLWGVNVAVQRHANPVLGLSPGFDLRVSW